MTFILSASIRRAVCDLRLGEWTRCHKNGSMDMEPCLALACPVNLQCDFQQAGALPRLLLSIAPVLSKLAPPSLQIPTSGGH